MDQTRKTQGTLASDLLEAAEEMVAIEKGEATPARSHRYVGDVLVEVKEGERVVWSLDEARFSPEAAAEAKPKAIREALHQTQEGFASLLHVSVGTLRGWEQGRRSPRGPAATLLRLAAVEPSALLKLYGLGRRAGQGSEDEAPTEQAGRLTRTSPT
jgi:putative transcriptional regulator